MAIVFFLSVFLIAACGLIYELIAGALASYLLGDSILQLDDGIALGTGFHVYRMPAGMTTMGHRHNGHEQFLILDGELHESDGTILRAGDLVFYRDGTEHHSYTPNGCLLAVHIAGPEFPVD